MRGLSTLTIVIILEMNIDREREKTRARNQQWSIEVRHVWRERRESSGRKLPWVVHSDIGERRSIQAKNKRSINNVLKHRFLYCCLERHVCPPWHAYRIEKKNDTPRWTERWYENGSSCFHRRFCRCLRWVRTSLDDADGALRLADDDSMLISSMSLFEGASSVRSIVCAGRKCDLWERLGSYLDGFSCDRWNDLADGWCSKAKDGAGWDPVERCCRRWEGIGGWAKCCSGWRRKPIWLERWRHSFLKWSVSSSSRFSNSTFSEISPVLPFISRSTTCLRSPMRRPTCI